MRATAPSKGPKSRHGSRGPRISTGLRGQRLTARRSCRSLAIALTLSSGVGLLVLSACTDSSTPSGPAGCADRPIRVGVASSLREISEGVRTRLTREMPEIQIEQIFGASSTHARQLRLGAPFDVLVSADAELMKTLAEGGWIEAASIREIARGELVLLGSASLRPAALETSQPSIDATAFFRNNEVTRVAIPSEVVPLGRYARAWLHSKNLLPLLDGKLVITENARANLSAVEAGHVDLAFGYASDRTLLQNARFLSALNANDYPVIRYVAARTTRAADCAGVQTALSAWNQPGTQSALAEAGFSMAEHEVGQP